MEYSLALALEVSLVISVSGGVLGPGNIGLAAHFIGDLDGDLLAHGSGDLPGVLLGNLAALLLHVLLALGAAGVSRSISGLGISLSLSLAISVSMADDLGVVTDDSAGAVDLLVSLLAVLCDNVLALLNVGGVHDGVILLVALLVVLGGVLGGAVLLVVAIVVVATTRGSDGTGGQASNNDKVNHLGMKFN